MRLTVLGQMIKGAWTEPAIVETKAAALERIKWLLWHGNAPEAIDDIECLADDVAANLDEAPTSTPLRKLGTTLGEFVTYIGNNVGHIVDYGERFRAGERINLAIDPATGAGDHLDDLALLTTFRRPEERHFTTTRDTSAATALAARMAAQILAERPELRPQTVRGLLVHSAEWTAPMLARLSDAGSQQIRESLVRRYGYGVPDLERALRSLQNDVTLVIEGVLQPFERDGSTVGTKELTLHDLPWPASVLERAGAALVQMKVTLSYFIEPNPGERGWTRRHTYASHGLRFAVKRSEETLPAFGQRINAVARDQGAKPAAAGPDDGWFLGPRLRDRGSLIADIWEGTAGDLASRHAIAVYPIGGWWKEKAPLRRYERQVRYSLIVSLRAPQGIDLYTPIQNSIAIQTPVAVGIPI
jgi:Subtilase family